MKTTTATKRGMPRGVLSWLVPLGLVLTASVAHATSGYYSTWSGLYSGSASENNAGCELCHGNSTTNLNPYGHDLAVCNGKTGTITQRLQAAESLNSDGDPGGYTNIQEIDANTQPGWTTTPVTVWNRSTCITPSPGTNTYSGSGDVDPVSPETCDNGVDDNGNGLIDCADPGCDGFMGGATSCGIGACASMGNLVCQTPDQGDTCTPGTPGAEGPFGDASCSDGIDNDCDGSTDTADTDCEAPQETCTDGIDNNGNDLIDCADPQCDGYVYGPTSCGTGACAAAGQEVCQTPDQVDTCTPGTPGAEGPFGDASCSDGIDNDCDGQTDAADPDCEAPPEVCDNGVDDNGNTLTDCADPQCDGFTDGSCSTGQPGICAAGTFVCQEGGQACVQNQPAGTEGPFGDTSCEDGLDNDCDGQTDGDDTSCSPVPEICNSGTDEDGDGLIDCADPDCDGFMGGTCDTGNPGICAAGTSVCRELQQFCDQIMPAGMEGPFGDASCGDQQDNDCDGLTDAADPDCEAPPEICDNDIDDNDNGLIDCEDPQCDSVTFGACDTGSPGICAAGTLTCDGSATGPACIQDQAAGTEGPSGSPSCTDSLDNDCDGLTDAADSGCNEPAVEICDNGIDDDGDGLADCADPDCDGFTDGACDTGNPGICAAGTFVCQDSGQACVQDQSPGTEGPSGSPTCMDGLDNDCDGLVDADDQDCAAPAGDVYLSRLQVPKMIIGMPDRVAKRKVMVRGDATQVTQDATVVLSAVASPNLGVVIDPASYTQEVEPGRPETKLMFSVSITCNAEGPGTVDWTAIISAPANDDLSNDEQSGTTTVECSDHGQGQGQGTALYHRQDNKHR